MDWKITEETIRNLCRDGEGGVRSDPASLSIAVDGLLHALSEVQRQIDLLGLDAAKHDCCTACTDGDGQPITGLRSLVGKRVHLLRRGKPRTEDAMLNSDPLDKQPDLFGYTPERLAKQIEREMRRRRRRMAWAKCLRAIGGGMLMVGIVAAIVGIPWPGVARWPLLVALGLGPAMFLAGDILSGDILGGKL